MMSLFFTLGSIVHDWGWSRNGPFWTKKGQTWQACQRSKVVQKGPKQSTYVFLIIWDPFWAHLDPVGPFQTTNIFLPQMDKVGFCSGASEQKINSCLKWSKRVQHSCKRRKNQHRPIFSPKKLAPKKGLFFTCFLCAFPKNQHRPEKIAPTGPHSLHVFATLSRNPTEFSW